AVTRSTLAWRDASTNTIAADRRLFVLLSIAFLVTVLVRAAWIADAAAIDLRVADNFVNGYGLRWNVAERGQAYTDPLWILALSGVDVFVHQPYVAAWTLSIVLTVAAAAGVAFGVAVDAAAALLALLLFTFSKSFVEYSMAGFQAPLTVVLLAAFWLAYWQWP